MPELTNLDVEWVSLVDRAAVRDPAQPDEPQRFLIWKRDNYPQGEQHMTDDLQKSLDEAKAERDEAVAKVEKAESESKALREEIDTLKAEVEKAAKKKAQPVDDDNDADDGVNKSELAPEVRAALEKAEAREKEMGERLAKAEKIAKDEREIRVTREFISKAEGFKALPVKAAEFGPVLKAIHEGVSSEDFESLEKLLKAADEGLKQSDHFRSIGLDGDGPNPGNASREVEQKAADIRKADPNVSEADAFERVMKADRALQERYLAEMRSGAPHITPSVVPTDAPALV